jgi:argininosuccinate synthase
MKKIVLAYSGGLDTSCIVRWLRDRGYEVICFVADLGQGLGKGEDLGKIETRALSAGARKVYIKDLQDEFVNGFILPALQAHAVYEGSYVLATALGRPLIAKYLVEVAHKERATAVAHGCTGKGNDQVRLEVTVGILDPRLEILAPVREWEFKSRDEEIDYAKKHNIPIETTKKKPYSIDRNIWGVSIEAGVLEDLKQEPPEDAYVITRSPQKAPATPEYIEIGFEKGAPISLNGAAHNLKGLIQKLNDTGGRHGVGRVDMVENRLVGIKSREIYEAPAATILLQAHRALEGVVLDRELAHFKDMLSMKYAELVYYGLWYSPLRQALDSFMRSTQRYVSGSIRLKLYKGACTVVSRSSPHSLYKKELSTYGKEDRFNQKLAEGFIRLWGMPYQR